MIDLYGVPDGEIPIFFTTDDNYIPFLDVAVSSLIRNASEDYRYRILILNTGIRQENIDLVKRNEREGFTVDFVDISEQVKDIQSRFKEGFKILLVFVHIDLRGFGLSTIHHCLIELINGHGFSKIIVVLLSVQSIVEANVFYVSVLKMLCRKICSRAAAENKLV